MGKKIISTANAPAAIGPYSQAVASRQHPLGIGPDPLGSRDPGAGSGRHRGTDSAGVQEPEGDRQRRRARVSTTWSRLTVFLTDLSHFALVNKIMAEYFREPYPARASIGVASLPRGAQVEVECIVAL